jgi:hypothetical protein
MQLINGKMDVKKIIFFSKQLLLSCLIMILLISNVFASYPQLTEMKNRISRIDNSGIGETYEKPYELLFDDNNNLKQDELLIFRDPEFDTLIWKVTSDPALMFYHNGINKQIWNKDGSKISLRSDRRCWYYDDDNQNNLDCFSRNVYVMDSDGTNLDIIIPNGNDVPILQSGQTDMDYTNPLALYSTYPIWSKENNNYMYFAYYDGLYEVDINNNYATKKIQTLPNYIEGDYVHSATNIRKQIWTPISENNILMVNDRFQYAFNDERTANLYFINLSMAESDECVNIEETYETNHRCFYYDINFKQELFDHPDHESAHGEYSAHDIGFQRNKENTFTFGYGSEYESGDYVSWEIPLDGNPNNIKEFYSKNLQDTNVRPYYGHPSFAYGGEHVLFTNYNAQTTVVYNHDDNTQISQVLPDDITMTHSSWSGYNKNVAYVHTGKQPSAYIWKVDPFVENSGEKIVSLDGEISGSYYYSYPRPEQSPDGTKVAFSSSMFRSSANNIDTYIALGNYPSPPTNLRLDSTTSVSLKWTLPENNREIKGYNIYKSRDNPNSYQKIRTLYAGEEFIDVIFHPNYTMYYGISSVDNSGIESKELSNIIKVTNDSGDNLLSYENYLPSLSNWDQTPPPVLSVEVTKINGHTYSLFWTAYHDLDVRHYNIYYSDTNNPTASQEYLIASVLDPNTNYIDWLALNNVDAFYGVTAVDYQGNEGNIVYSSSDGCITNNQMKSYINNWLDNNILSNQLINYIIDWKNGC